MPPQTLHPLLKGAVETSEQEKLNEHNPGLFVGLRGCEETMISSAPPHRGEADVLPIQQFYPRSLKG